MKLTKLQKDAFRLARWWRKPGFEKLPVSVKIADRLDEEVCATLHWCNIWDTEVYASSILSEVM